MCRRLLYCFALSLVLLLLASCASRRTAATLDDVETYIQFSPDSALAIIRTIDTTTLTTRSLRAHYALLHAMALDKNWIDTTDVGVVMPAVDYYAKHGTADESAMGVQNNPDTEKKIEVLFSKKPKLYFVACGTADPIVRGSYEYVDYLKSHNYPCHVLWTDGAHTWKNWRNYLVVFGSQLFK